MKEIRIDLMPDNSEIVHYDTPGVPLYIRKGILSNYPRMRAQCHWHDDIELILVLEGKMNYYINGKTVLIRERDGIFINTREMHYGFAQSKKECVFLCILFHPSLLMSCKHMSEQYVLPLLNDRGFSFLYLSHRETPDILDRIQTLWDLKNSQKPCYQLETIGCLYALWSAAAVWYHQISHVSYDPSTELSSDITILRKMVSYIHVHYKETIALNDIAEAGNICKSKCCSIFKEQTCQSPFSFLNSYRLHVSADLLKNTTRSVTDISFECGFNHVSYFSKLFFRYFACTPSDYRKISR